MKYAVIFQLTLAPAVVLHARSTVQLFQPSDRSHVSLRSSFDGSLKNRWNLSTDRLIPLAFASAQLTQTTKKAEARQAESAPEVKPEIPPENPKAQPAPTPRQLVKKYAVYGLIVGIIIGSALGVAKGIAVARGPEGRLGGITSAVERILVVGGLGALLGGLVGIGKVLGALFPD